MIRRKEQIRIREVPHAQGGAGSVFFHDWLLPEEAKGHGRVFSKIVLPVGSSIGPHRHTGEFEAFYVLSGKARVTDGDCTVELAPGDMHLCRDGDLHGVACAGDEPLEILALIMNSL